MLALLGPSRRCRGEVSRRDVLHVGASVLSRIGPFFVVLLFATGTFAQIPPVALETPAEATLRHERVAQRRRGVEIICHRGALEFAHENTLEAYRATLELGGDGNEIDIRATREGVLVCFHDDMLDRLLEAYGTVREVDWEELRSFRFREPGPFGEHCRIPTLVEVFELHRQHAGLIHLDLKEPGLDVAIAELLDRLDMWDHVAYCNPENAAAIVQNSKLRLSRYKAGLYEDRGEVDPAAIAHMLQRPGNGVILEDPRGVLVALGRPIGKVSNEPVAPVSWGRQETAAIPPIDDLIATLVDADDWNRVAESEAFAALEERIRQRSLHKHWMFHGFDTAMSVRSLIRLRAPRAVEVARHVLWLDDPALESVHNPIWKTPRSWTDFRVKMHVFPSLAELPGPATEQLCREYLALSDEAARVIGPPQFDEAARTLLAVSPTTATALELMRHRLRVVRGRVILDCLSHADDPWAHSALQEGSPHALAYILHRLTGEVRGASGGNTVTCRTSPSLACASGYGARGACRATVLAPCRSTAGLAPRLGRLAARAGRRGSRRGFVKNSAGEGADEVKKKFKLKQ